MQATSRTGFKMFLLLILFCVDWSFTFGCTVKWCCLHLTLFSRFTIESGSRVVNMKIFGDYSMSTVMVVESRFIPFSVTWDSCSCECVLSIDRNSSWCTSYIYSQFSGVIQKYCTRCTRVPSHSLFTHFPAILEFIIAIFFSNNESYSSSFSHNVDRSHHFLFKYKSPYPYAVSRASADHEFNECYLLHSSR